MTTTPYAKMNFFMFGYALYHGVLGIIGYDDYQRPSAAVSSIILYIAAIGLAMLYRLRSQLPLPVTVLSLVAAGVVPYLGAYATGEFHTSAYQSWYVGGIGVLMVILVVRQRLVYGWLGTVIMVAEVSIRDGSEALIGGGIVGAVMLVTAAHGLSWSQRQSMKAAEVHRLTMLQNHSERVSLTANRTSAHFRLQRTLQSAMPVLALIQKKKGNLTRAEAKQAVILEAGLRDQIRAKGLMDDELVKAVNKARERGVEVQLIDDGGMAGLTDKEKRGFFEKLVESLDDLNSGKVVIRSVEGEEWTISMLAIENRSETPSFFLRF